MTGPETDAARQAAIVVEHAEDQDIAAISALNNLFAPDGLTLPRSEEFVTSHLQDYQVVRDTDGTVLGWFEASGVRPRFLNQVSARGTQLSADLFRPETRFE